MVLWMGITIAISRRINRNQKTARVSCVISNRYTKLCDNPHMTASIMIAKKINAKYMLDQRYIVQATLLPPSRQTRHAAYRSKPPKTNEEIKYTVPAKWKIGSSRVTPISSIV